MGVSSTSTTPLGAASIVGNGGGTMGAVREILWRAFERKIYT